MPKMGVQTRGLQKFKPVDEDKKAVIDAYGKGAMGVLESIRQGTVDEEELDKLHNFVVTSLTLMDLVPLSTFRRAQKAALVRSTRGEGPTVVKDPRLTGEEYADT